MERYEKYKDSGVSDNNLLWIGDIPKHWNVKSLKHSADVVLGKMLTNEDKGGYQLKPYLRAKNIEWVNVNIQDVKTMWFSDKEISQYRLKKGDILVSEGGEVGRSCIWNEELNECYIQNSVHKVTIDENCSPKYFLFLFILYGERGYFESIVNKISIAHLTKEKLSDIKFISPPLSEQTAIANYLDQKTTELDTLITKKERLIELLQEERTAIINQAVTKGLDPDVEMKDSQIEWLGEIPAHWEVKKLKYVFDSKNTIRVPLNAEERGNMENKIYDYYGASGVIDFVDNYLFDEETILIGEDGANLLTRSKRLAFIARGKYWVNNHAHILKPKNGNIEYLCELLELLDYTESVSGSAQPKLTQEALMSIDIFEPPVEEQDLIFEFLKKEFNRVDTIISKTNQEITLLKEYKTALISEVVTGKVKVI